MWQYYRNAYFKQAVLVTAGGSCVVNETITMRP